MVNCSASSSRRCCWLPGYGAHDNSACGRMTIVWEICFLFLLGTSCFMFPSLFCNKAWPCVLVNGTGVEISHATCNTGHINKSFTHDSFSCPVFRLGVDVQSKLCRRQQILWAWLHVRFYGVQLCEPCLSLAGLCKGKQNSSFKPLGFRVLLLK